MITGISRLRTISPATAVGASVIATVALAGATAPLSDPDAWWHLLTGQWILEHGRIPTMDFMTFTSQGEAYIPHSWLFEVAMATVEAPFGLAGLAALRVLLVVATFGVLARVLSRRASGANALVPWTLVVLAVGSSIASWSLRPYLSSYLLLIPTLVLLDRDGRERWLLVPILLLWANLHGLFLLALGLVSLKVIVASVVSRSPRWDWLAVAGGSGVATLVNPFGLRLHLHLVELSASMKEIDVMEWRMTDFSRSPHWFWAVLLGLALWLLWRYRSDVPPFHWLLVITAASLGVYAVRNLAPTALILAFVCAPRLAARRTRPSTSHDSLLPALTIAVAMTVLVAVAVLRTPTEATPESMTANTLPVELTRQLQPGRVFTMDAWGGLVSYLNWPDVLVAYDTRIDFHGAEAFETYRDIVDGKGHAWFAEHCVNQVLALDRWPLSSDLTADGSWTVVGREPLAAGENAILFRRSSEGCPIGS